MRRPRVFTWHVHGSYLYYLSHADADFYVPTRPGWPEGYGGRRGTLPWPDNLIEVPAHHAQDLALDCILFQSSRNYLHDQFEILSEKQRHSAARIFLEHDPPREGPTDTKHVFDDPHGLLVHCTPFNLLMWDNGRTPACFIDHGVTVPEDVAWTGELPRGLVIVNGLQKRGRRLGADIFEQVRREIPLDLVGMQSEECGGLGEIPNRELPYFAARYRFLFNPIRYTSMGLAVCESMMAGLPVIGLATTEMATAVQSGVSGYVDTDLHKLIAHMKRLLSDHAEARRLSAGAQQTARQRFSLERFAADWNRTFTSVLRPAATRPSATLEGAAR
ncbi:MAG: glycosyltransferase [Bryobacteraceae bacterium]|nr:glycosyltransferase [Bryobacteraceae bacterium]